MRFRCLTLCVSLLLSAGLSAAEPSPLASSASEFVRAQAGSAVHWHAWNDATLAEAKQQKLSVYVFIGSPLSELARATINQTFTSAKTVEWLNQNFFCIFVDGDARPDLASYGQHYIRSVKQLQGVPVHLWLTPDLQPYDGANYLPPSEEWGKPGFLKAARSALDTWTASPDRAHAFAKEALDMMRVLPLAADSTVGAAARLEVAAKSWIASIDPVNGGFGTAPKQPEPEVIRFLLARGDAASREAALNAARALVKGAARDSNDGGFYRRCIDEAWKEPYYQKTLLDQARIALALFEAADSAKDDSLRQAGVGALDFAVTQLRNADGHFVAALDGTLDEAAVAANQPKFARVGQASTGALGLLVSALQRSGEKRLANVATQVAARLDPSPAGALDHLSGSREPGTATDFLAAALGFRALGNVAAANRLEARATERYFDPATGAYQTAPVPLPPGIAVRTPGYGDTPSADVLALLAGVDAVTATRLRASLLAGIEYDDQPPGDVLLGLSQGK